MGKLLSGFVLAFVVVGGLATGSSGHVEARLNKKDESGMVPFSVFSTQKLKQVEVQLEENGKWLPLTEYPQQGEDFPYAVYLPKVGADQEIILRGIYGRTLFTDRVYIGASSEIGKGKVELKVESVSEEHAPISHQEMLYGADDLEPQVIAQTRVNYMAARGLSGHMGSGVIRTKVGTLCEGWGMGGGPTCVTCVGAGAPLADAHCQMANGSYQRIRFYHGGTWSPGGGGGGRGRGRRR